MSGSFSYYLETQLLSLVFNGTPYVPTGIYVGLFTSPPSPSAPGTELSGNAYSRAVVAFSAVAPGPPPVSSNSAVLQWPPATADWGVIIAAGLFDQFVGGNMISQGLLVSPLDGITPTPVTIFQGDIFYFPIGAIQVGFAPSSIPGASPLQPSRQPSMIARPTMRPIPHVVRSPSPPRQRFRA